MVLPCVFPYKDGRLTLGAAGPLCRGANPPLFTRFWLNGLTRCGRTGAKPPPRPGCVPKVGPWLILPGFPRGPRGALSILRAEREGPAENLCVGAFLCWLVRAEGPPFCWTFAPLPCSLLFSLAELFPSAAKTGATARLVIIKAANRPCFHAVSCLAAFIVSLLLGSPSEPYNLPR